MTQNAAIDQARGKRATARSEKATRESILDAAAALIVNDGMAACTMRSISEKVNIKAGSLYHHFSSKDEIVVEIMNKGVERLLDEVRGAVESRPDDAGFADRLATAVRVHVACKTDKHLLFMQVYEHLTPIIKRQGRVMRKRYADFWKDLIEAGKASGEVRADLSVALFVPYVLSGLNRTPEWFNAEHMVLDEVVQMIVDTLTSGILVARTG